jgi:hypothetical protein
MDSADAKEAPPTILLLKKPFTDRQLLSTPATDRFLRHFHPYRIALRYVVAAARTARHQSADERSRRKR